jgi:hypothetical protein
MSFSSQGEPAAMPIHDWTRVDARFFHAFRLDWISDLSQSLNSGHLPSDHYALIQQRSPDPLPEGLDEAGSYARKADRIGVHDQWDQLVDVVDIVSPGIKAYETELRSFVSASAGLILQVVHPLVIDLFPSIRRDPREIPMAIWEEFYDEELELPPDTLLTLAADAADLQPAAYVEPVAVGDLLPDMPFLLRPGFQVPAPLEATYQTVWSVFPAPLKRLLDTPRSQGNGR